VVVRETHDGDGTLVTGRIPGNLLPHFSVYQLGVAADG
jgi:hypothetical protein